MMLIHILNRYNLFIKQSRFHSVFHKCYLSTSRSDVNEHGRFYKEFVKPQEFYDEWAAKRKYFYNVDLQGQLFLEETMPKNVATCLKSPKFLKFFFSRIRENNTGEFVEDYPFVSPCGKEMNFIRSFDSRTPIVFNDLTNISSFEAEQQQELVYGGSLLKQEFDPSQLHIDNNGHLYHTLHNRKLTLGLIASNVSVQLAKTFVPSDDSSSGLAFEWRDQLYPIHQLDNNSETIEN